MGARERLVSWARRTWFPRWRARRIPRAPLEHLSARFRPNDLGVTQAAEVAYVGRGAFPVPGGTSDAEAWILAVLAKDARRMFEFGTCTGKTSYLWARNQPTDGTVTTLTLAPTQLGAYHGEGGDDLGAEEFALRESAFTRFLYTGTDVESRVTQLYGDSKDFDEAPLLGSYDVVFVDGSHAYSYVVSDTQKALLMVRPGGLVLWHDYSPECPGVFRALNELAAHLPLVRFKGTTLVAFRKVPANT